MKHQRGLIDAVAVRQFWLDVMDHTESKRRAPREPVKPVGGRQEATLRP